MKDSEYWDNLKRARIASLLAEYKSHAGIYGNNNLDCDLVSRMILREIRQVDIEEQEYFNELNCFEQSEGNENASEN